MFALEAARGQALCSHSFIQQTLAQPLLHNGRFMLLLSSSCTPVLQATAPPTCSRHGTLTWARGAKGEVPRPAAHPHIRPER